MGVERDATDKELRKAYMKLALKLHPDKQKGEDTTEAFTTMSNAYEFLKDRTQRAYYDILLQAKEAAEKTQRESSARDARREGRSSSSKNQYASSSPFEDSSSRGAPPPPPSSQQRAYGSTPNSQHSSNNASGSSSSSSNTPPSGNSSSRSRTSDKPHDYRKPSSDGYADRPKSGTHRSSKPPRIFGVRNDGQPCSRCIKYGCYCYQHVNQDPSFERSHGKSTKEKKQHGASPSPSSAGGSTTTYGVRLDGQPCKRCIRKGTFCYQHEAQQNEKPASSPPPTFGKCPNGEACKRCTQEGRYCKQHLHQQPPVFGMCQNGLPCKRCIKHGGYCHQHQYQQAYAGN